MQYQRRNEVGYISYTHCVVERKDVDRMEALSVVDQTGNALIAQSRERGMLQD